MDDGATPVLSVVRGDPTTEELAALVVALRPRRGDAPAPTPAGRWADPASRLRTSLRPAPGAWRWSSS